MRTLRQCIAFFLVSSMLYAETFGDVKYLYKPEGEDKGQEIVGSLDVDASGKTLLFKSLAPKKQKKHKKARPDVSLEVKSDSITSTLYERASKPRYLAALLVAWPLIFTREKKHFLTIQYGGLSGVQSYAVFHLDKGNFRSILAAIEAATGKKVERSEEH
jgi:hypothetical protein